MQEFSSKTFSRLLGCADTQLIRADKSAGLSFLYKVPPSLCRNISNSVGSSVGNSVGNSATPELSSSAILALFDELSTYCIMIRDKTHRAGVSVVLSTKIIKSIKANDEVIIHTIANKIGKTLGFCTMEMRNKENGELLAYGKHIKFVQMGLLWDILGNRKLLPYTLQLYDYFSTTSRTNSNGSKSIFGNLVIKLLSWSDKKEQHDKSNIFANSSSIRNEIGKVFDLLDVQELSNSVASNDNGVSSNGNSVVTDNFMKICRNNSDQLLIRNESNEIIHEVLTNKYSTDRTFYEQNSIHYNVKVLPHMKNLLGVMHGGAVATSIEEANVKYLYKKKIQLSDGNSTNSNTKVMDWVLEHMEITYLSSMKGDLIISVMDDRHLYSSSEEATSSRQNSLQINGDVRDRKGNVCAEYVCSWNRR